METKYNGHSSKAGIYQIRNLNNGRVYIGSAKLFSGRYQQHISSLKKGTHHNKHLQSAFNLEGTDAFVFEVLQVVEGEQADRLLVEQKHLDLLMSDWNLCYNFMKKANAEGRSCFSKDPEATRVKLSKAQKALWQDPVERAKRIEGGDGKRRENISRSARKVFEQMSQEEKEELSRKRKETARLCWSDEEYRDRVSKLNKRPNPKLAATIRERCRQNPEYKKVLLSNLDKANATPRDYKMYCLVEPEGREIITTTRLSQFCLEHGLLYQAMRAVVSGRQVSHRGWKHKKFD